MKKLKAVIQYECTTCFKYIWLFYAIEFGILSILSGIIYFSIGTLEKSFANSLEVNTIIYISILSTVGSKEDFKMLIQNGFTRKFIFLATFSLFVFVSVIMATVDTFVSRVLYAIFGSGYGSFFGQLYGTEHSAILNWLWLFLVYMMSSCLLYLITLLISKLGKMISIFTGIVLGLMVAFVLPVLFRFVIPNEMTEKMMELVMKGFGFMLDGSVNLVYPVVLFTVLAGAIGAGAYMIMRKTELKG